MSSSLYFTDRLLPTIANHKQRLAAWIQLALVSRPAWRGRAEPVPPGTVLHTSPMPLAMNAVCLFAHFQAEGSLKNGTIKYLQALQANNFHIVLISTSPLTSEAVTKLAAYCHTIIQRENSGLDFASWKCATNLLPEALEAKELLLANDSVLYVGDLAAVFEIMGNVRCDFWGMTASKERRMHLQSYFLCLRQSALHHPSFQAFWRKIAVLSSKQLIIRRYESSLTLRLLLAGLCGGAFIPWFWLPDGGATNPTLEHGSLLCRYFQMPFLKKQFLQKDAQNHKTDISGEKLCHVEAPIVDVLLPTYNGERYLPAQLESLKNSQKVTVNILARDDGSTDGTLAVLRSFMGEQADAHIFSGERLGVMGNINALLTECEAGESSHYFALCDQDDIWYPHKLRLLYDAMKTLESRHGSNVPLLVCSDARCVDEQGRELYPSFLRHLGLPENWGHTPRNVLVMSFALGCSCLGNAALRRMALPLPSQDAVFMHDWWLLLIASYFGTAHCIHQPLLDYRQHVGNSLGAKGRGTLLERLRQNRQNARRTQRQAATFLDRFKERLTPAQRAEIAAWANMPETPWASRLWHCWRQGFGKPGLRWFTS